MQSFRPLGVLWWNGQCCAYETDKSNVVVVVSGQFPGPIIFGLIFDQACLVWQEKCDDVGACWVYDSAHLSWGFFYIAIVVKCISCLSYVAALCLYRAPQTETTVIMTHVT